ncbi:MAG: hypothetical protein V4521_07025 [Pseudomonadota bacterium]
MFDLLSWTWEYEPTETEGYIPDFLLYGVGNRRVYVEVKPGLIYWQHRVEILAKALNALAKVGSDELLVLTEEFRDCSCADAPVFGYMPVDESDLGKSYEFDEEAVLFQPGKAYGTEFDFAYTLGSWAGRLSGAYDGNALFEGTQVGRKPLLELWSRAGNAIQWKPR